MKRTIDSDLIKLGIRLKEARKRKGWTLEQAARRMQLSKGLLSKIENFRAIPSLPVLCTITRTLGEDMGEIFKGFGANRESPNFILTLADERLPVEREDSKGLHYELLGSRNSGSEAIEAFILKIPSNSRRKRVTADGEQFIYVLEGCLDFVYGNETLTMGMGDSLLFDGRIPHAPRCRGKQSATLLALYFLKSENDNV